MEKPEVNSLSGGVLLFAGPPGRNRFHLIQKSLPLGAFYGGGLLVITESELIPPVNPD